MQGKIIADRYRILEERFHHKLYTVYEALDQRENKPVQVKLLNEEVKKNSLDRYLRFIREVEGISRGAHPNLLNILAFGQLEGRDYLVTEDVSDVQPLSDYVVQNPPEVDHAVDIVLQVCSGLALAHELGVLHRAINPSNILVSPRKDRVTVKLANFGLGLLIDLVNVKEDHEIINLFGYMAPEAAGILRKPVDERSDVYSLGIVFYQLLTGSLPYQGKATSTLIHQHIAQKPLPPSRANPSIPPVMEHVVLRMIAKDPADRYQTIAGLITDLGEYRRQRAEGTERPDFEIARRDRAGYLTFSTRLIGREKELETLQNLIGRSRRRNGAIALVYGPPGVGKSRLIDELRGSVYSFGGIFAGGKCDQYESTTPFKVFAEALDAYVERIKRASKEDRDAAVDRIKEAVGELGGEAVKIAPAIVDLIGEQPPLRALEPEKEKYRFMITAASFILSLGSDEHPFIMFLDDLQWADEGSIELMTRVAQRLTNQPIVLIAGYRDTDLYEGHPWVGAVQKLKSEPLPISEIPVSSFNLRDTTQLISEILIERDEDILPLTKQLQERTKGNVFFVIELLRSLADDNIVYYRENHYRFDMEKLSAASLPTNIVDVVIKRIHDISDENWRILSYGSIMGRAIELEPLSKVTGLSRENVLDALEEGIRTQILVRDVVGKEKVHFVHDKIREAFYSRINERERTDLHRRYAVLLEEVHKNNVYPVLFDLAYHYEQAGIKEKTVVYTIQAGKKAQSSYALDQAIRSFEVAKNILRKQGETRSERYIDTLDNLGSAYYQAGRFDEALKTLRACESLVPDEEKLQKADVLSKIGDTLQKKGELKACEKVLVTALKELGVGLPGNIATVTLGILKQLFVHGLHSVFPALFVRKKYSGEPKAEVVAHLLWRLFYLYYFMDLTKSIYVLLRAQNMAERALGPSRMLSQIAAVAGMTWMQVGWAWWARRNARVAEKIAEDLNDRACLGLAGAFYAWVEHPYSALQSIKYAGKAVELLKGVGEYWDLGHAGCCLLWGEQKVGRNFHELIEENRDQIAIMESINALQNLGWAFGMEGLFLTYIGDGRLKNEGIRILEKSIELLEEVNDKPWVLCARGYLAYAHLRAENYGEAVREADWVAERFLSNHNLTTWLLDILGMCAQVYLYTVFNSENATKTERAIYLKKAKYLCTLARLKGWMYPNYRGWAYQVGGTYRWLKGKKKRAIRTWEQGIAYLRSQTHDAYRLGCILLEEASFLLKDNPNDRKAEEYLLEAKELFVQLGATYDLGQTEKLLGAVSPANEPVEAREKLTLTRHLESLLSVTRTIGSVFDLEELLDKIVEQAMKVTGAERGFLLLYDGPDKALRVSVSHGMDTELASLSFSYEDYKISLEMVQEVEKGKEALVVSENSSAFPGITSELKEYGVKEALCILLMVKEKPLGLIYLDNRLAGGIFGQDELELMKSFAVQASVSIENARLVKEVVEQERLMQKMIEQAADAILLHEVDGKIINVNQQACDKLGYTRQELLNMRVTDIEMSDEAEQMTSIPEALERGAITFSGMHKRKDGSMFPVETRLGFIEYRGRKLVLSLARDITERKRAEEAIVKAKEDWENTFDATADMVMLLDNEHHIIRVNKAAAAALDTTKENLVGKRCYEAIHGKKRPIRRCPLVLTMKTLEAHTMEMTEPNLGGSFICSTSPILNREGKLTGYTHTLKDITESKRLGAQLQQAQKMEAIGSLAGGVAHDLNNILAGIVSYPDLLLMQVPEDSPLRNPILTIRESGKKAADIVQDLLTMARRGVASTQVENLNDIISEYLESPEYKKLKSYHPDVVVETDLEADLLCMMGSRIHLSKTIMNLVSNGAEAMPNGGTVSISTQNRYMETSIQGHDNEKKGDYVTLTVSDTGIGIPPEDLERVFEPFFTKKKMGRSGTGLGMAVVWGTVKDHNGHIDVQSEEGAGTRFTLFFPATREEPARVAPDVAVEDYMGHGQSVLVVDDAKEQRDIAFTILTELGYSVTCVSSGEEAVDYMKSHSVDLLLLDMIMDPGMDGLDTYRQIVQFHPGQKAVIASGFSETRRVKEAQRLGAGRYIKKPYTIEKIGTAIKRQLEEQRA